METTNFDARHERFSTPLPRERFSPPHERGLYAGQLGKALRVEALEKEATLVAEHQINYWH